MLSLLSEVQTARCKSCGKPRSPNVFLLLYLRFFQAKILRVCRKFIRFKMAAVLAAVTMVLVVYSVSVRAAWWPGSGARTPGGGGVVSPGHPAPPAGSPGSLPPGARNSSEEHSDLESEGEDDDNDNFENGRIR